MAFGQRQIVHVCVEVMVAVGTAVLRVRENNITWSASQRVSQIVQSAGNRSKPVGTVLAQRTGPPFIVAAASDKLWLRQILNTCDSLCFICYIFAWSKHLDNLQHRFKFLCWNIGTWAQDTSKILCIAATVSEILEILGPDPILFGSGFAVGLAGLHGAQYFRRAWSQRPYRGMRSLDVRSMKRGCNHDGD